MDKEFIEKCDEEIERNKHKGDWKKYAATRKDIMLEILWHQSKLAAHMTKDELEDIDVDMICEYAADIANICEKIYTLAKEKGIVAQYGEYGVYLGSKSGWSLDKKPESGKDNTNTSFY